MHFVRTQGVLIGLHGGCLPLRHSGCRLLHVARDVDPNPLDDALNQLAEVKERQARIVEMRFFAGLNSEEIGSVLGIPASTVQREWRMARAWLQRELDSRD